MKKYYFFNTGLICIPEVFIRCKVWGLREPGGGGREFLIDLFLELKQFWFTEAKKQPPDVLFKKSFVKRFIKKVTLTQVFSCDFAKFLGIPFLQKNLRMTASKSNPPKSQSYLNF